MHLRACKRNDCSLYNVCVYMVRFVCSLREFKAIVWHEHKPILGLISVSGGDKLVLTEPLSNEKKQSRGRVATCSVLNLFPVPSAGCDRRRPESRQHHTRFWHLQGAFTGLGSTSCLFLSSSFTYQANKRLEFFSV